MMRGSPNTAIVQPPVEIEDKADRPCPVRTWIACTLALSLVYVMERALDTAFSAV